TMVQLVGNHGVIRVDKSEDLLPHGLDHLRVRVTDSEAAKPTSQIEVTVAIDVLDDPPFAAGDDDGLGIRGNGAGHPRRRGRRQRARPGAGNVARDPDGSHRLYLRWWPPVLTRRLEGLCLPGAVRGALVSLPGALRGAFLCLPGALRGALVSLPGALRGASEAHDRRV